MSARLQTRKNAAAASLQGGLYCADCNGGPYAPGVLQRQRDGRFTCKRCGKAARDKAERKKQHALFDDNRGQSTSLFDRLENRVEGFIGGDGRFHPIRKSADYNEFKAGDFDRARAPKRTKKPKPIGKRKKAARAARARSRRAEQKAAGIRPKSRVKPISELTLSQYVRRSGGLTASGTYAGEAKRLGSKQAGTTGLVNKRAGFAGKGGVWRKVSPEMAMDRANEVGFLDPKTGGAFEDVGRFLEAVEFDARGGRHVIRHPGKEYDLSDSRYMNPFLAKPVVIVGKYAVAHLSTDRVDSKIIGRLLSREGKGYYPVGPRGQSFKMFRTIAGAKKWGRDTVNKFDASAEGRGKGWALTKNPTESDRQAYAAYKQAAKEAKLKPASFAVWYGVVTDPLTLGIGAADKDRFVGALAKDVKRRAGGFKNPAGVVPEGVVTWRTHKTAGGYKWDVFTVEYQKPSVILQTGTRPTRPQAVTKAKEWTRYFKALQRQAGKNPVAVSVSKVKVTPEVASRLLASYVGPDNPITWATVGKNARKMREGTFVAKSPLGLTADGRLHDGRHRLLGVVQSGKTITFEVARAKAARKNPSEDAKIAAVILQQLGGSGRLSSMVGARHFTAVDRGLSFQIPARGSAYNYAKIALNDSDTYDLTFIKYRGNKILKEELIENVHNSSLREALEHHTGLAFSLGTMGRQNPGRLVGAYRHAVAKHRVAGARQSLLASLKKVQTQIEDLEHEIIEYRHDPLWRDVKHAKKWAAEGSLRKRELQKIETRLRRELEGLPVINPARKTGAELKALQLSAQHAQTAAEVAKQKHGFGSAKHAAAEVAYKTASQRYQRAKARQANPSVKIDRTLADRHEMFQGRAATKVSQRQTAAENPAAGWELGRLVYVDVKTPKGVERIAGSMGPGGPTLNASKGNKLYICDLQHESPHDGKRRTYGEIVEIAYLTPKAHINNGRVTEYWHPLGEDTGERPSYAVNGHGWPLIVGGAYKIDERGIIN